MIKIILAMLCLGLNYQTCQQAQVKREEGISGKVIHRSCATIAIQVLDEKHYRLGQPTWQQAPGQTTYNYVFAVANQCSFPYELKVGEKFSFKILPADKAADDCILCELWDNPPAKKQLIQVSTKKEL